jgi:AhpD family alkylhydroperoxidase
MPRLRYIAESEKTPYIRELIESAKCTGAPDPRVVSLMTRSNLGIAWVEYWNKLLYQGTLPHKLKEMCRIKISVAHQCGYCSTVRSTVARTEGLTRAVHFRQPFVTFVSNRAVIEWRVATSGYWRRIEAVGDEFRLTP